MDWLEAHGDDEKAFLEEESVASSSNSDSPGSTCLKCNECKKRFKSLEGAELHAARTQHDDFIEAVWEEGQEEEGEGESEGPAGITVPVLSEEEKAARLAELRAKAAAKKAAREKESREAEVLRKASAKELEQVRRDLQDKEMKKLAEERRMEKIADRKRREEIKRQIEEDRENKRRQIEAEKARSEGVRDISVAVESAATPSTLPTLPSTSARIQIKLPPPHPPLKFLFDSPSTATLKDLKDRIKSECPANLKINLNELMQTFPTHVFTKKEDEMSLSELGLAPSATLMLK